MARWASEAAQASERGLKFTAQSAGKELLRALELVSFRQDVVVFGWIFKDAFLQCPEGAMDVLQGRFLASPLPFCLEK